MAQAYYEASVSAGTKAVDGADSSPTQANRANRVRQILRATARGEGPIIIRDYPVALEPGPRTSTSGWGGIQVGDRVDLDEKSKDPVVQAQVNATKAFKAQALDWLQQLAENREGQKLILTLATTHHRVYLHPHPLGGNETVPATYSDRFGNDSIVALDNATKVQLCGADGSVIELPDYIGLGHELFHALHVALGTVKSMDESYGDSPEERSAVAFEGKLAEAEGLPKRIGHTGHETAELGGNKAVMVEGGWYSNPETVKMFDDNFPAKCKGLAGK
jgi:hypothetical protein